MSSNEIRSSRRVRRDFLDFFKAKQHTVVPSASLMPEAPNLLFTNAGMNQFVPIFLGERKADVSSWPNVEPGLDTRAADTQKCIRAGGKHNDLEDVGFDTYHHTFFEMLGNWSFGDYFKQDAIEWAWELLTGVWKFPKERLYATIYKPGEGDPSELDQAAWDCWAEIFTAAGLDPKRHIVYGGKKDNFWMMGETGPCGPCSEIHMDLTPHGDTHGKLVNADSSDCIEIWNLVFIQFNANPDGSFSPLPAQHVDTGMGFERVCSVIQNTRGFTDFNRGTSNYETDVFRPIFDELEKLSGKRYGSTLPKEGESRLSEQEKVDVAFRVIGDHIRTLGFSIADGIQPGNNVRHYVLRRILRRAVRYGRSLDFHEPFFFKMVDVLADEMGDFFPEIREKKALVKEVIEREEVAFNKTLDRGIELFNEAVSFAETSDMEGVAAGGGSIPDRSRKTGDIEVFTMIESPAGKPAKAISGELAFKLYDTYGFPLDLTELMARERGLTVDTAGFDKFMQEQKDRARAAQKRDVIEVTDLGEVAATEFVGFEQLEASSKIAEIVQLKGKSAVILEVSPFYAAMGGQVGDQGEISHGGNLWRVADTQKAGDAWLHVLGDSAEGLEAGMEVGLSVDRQRRAAIQRHHTVTHVFHWALHEVVSRDATQKGSYVGPDKLTFDFNSGPLTPEQIRDIERLVNERVVGNDLVSWNEFPYAEVRDREDVMQLFGEKYGERVRVVQIGGKAGELNGYSMELCGGTHTKRTGEIGGFRILGESAIQAGVRRVEAIAGLEAYESARREFELIHKLAGRVNAPVGELEKKVENLLAQQKQLDKELRGLKQKQAAETAKSLVHRAQEINGLRAIIEDVGEEDGGVIQSMASALQSDFKGVAVLLGYSGGAVTLVAVVHPELTGRVQAGKIVQAIAPVVGGKGGGRPEQARGGGKDASKIGAALEKAKEFLAACPE